MSEATDSSAQKTAVELIVRLAGEDKSLDEIRARVEQYCEEVKLDKEEREGIFTALPVIVPIAKTRNKVANFTSDLVLTENRSADEVRFAVEKLLDDEHCSNELRDELLGELPAEIKRLKDVKRAAEQCWERVAKLVVEGASLKEIRQQVEVLADGEEWQDATREALFDRLPEQVEKYREQLRQAKATGVTTPASDTSLTPAERETIIEKLAGTIPVICGSYVVALVVFIFWCWMLNFGWVVGTTLVVLMTAGYGLWLWYHIVRKNKLSVSSDADISAEFVKWQAKRNAKSDQPGLAGKIIENIFQIVWLVIAVVAGLILLENNPTKSEFDPFILNEGFIAPAVERTDLIVASYYRVKGTFTGEERSYIGVCHRFFQLPQSKSGP